MGGGGGACEFRAGVHGDSAVRSHGLLEFGHCEDEGHAGVGAGLGGGFVAAAGAQGDAREAEHGQCYDCEQHHEGEGSDEGETTFRARATGGAAC